MESDLKNKLVQLEAQVAEIKDPALRQIAFGRLLDAVVGAPAPRSKPEPAAEPAGKKTSPARSATKAKGKSKAAEYYAIGQVRQEVQNLSVSGATKGLPSLKKCRLGWEKYLWVLAIAKRASVEGLNNHEIAFLLTKRFFKATKYTGVNNIRRKVESGFVTPDPETQRWVLTPEGEEHLKNLATGGDAGETK
ncbi:MAG: hypothetical protein QOH01_1800 [Verrucomicrobiota bacterium]|jgi:hypothetical protein